MRDRCVCHPALTGQEVVHRLDEMDALPRVRVPGDVLADALGEGAALARLTLLDVADLPGDARQVSRRSLAAPPVVVLGGGEAVRLSLGGLDPGEQLRP